MVVGTLHVIAAKVKIDGFENSALHFLPFGWLNATLFEILLECWHEVIVQLI